MKRNTRSLLLAIVATGLASLAAHADPLAAGTEIGVDFGDAPAPDNNFNDAGFVQNGSIAVGSIIDTKGTVVDDVGFSWTSDPNTFGSSSGANVTAGDPSVFNSSNTDDWLGMSAPDGLLNSITLTFTGLDDALTYDLVIGAGGGASGVADTTWTADGRSFTTDAAATDGSAYGTLNSLSTDGSGNLVITGDGAGSRLDIAAVSALHLTATIPDTTLPAWVNPWPLVDSETSSGATARGQIDEDGTAYYVVLTDGAAPPSAAQVKAGTDASDVAALASGSIALSANVEGTEAFSGLGASTAYDVYFVAEDLATNLQPSPVLVEFTTISADITAPAWVVGWPQVDSETTDGALARGQIDEDGTAYFVVLADGAAAPSAAQVKAGTDASDAAALASDSIVLGANAEGTDAFGGLSANTAYDVYFVAEDLATNLQASPVLVEFTTSPPAALAVGTEIGVDFGGAPVSDNNFNDIPNVQTDSIAAGGIIDTTGTVVDGVGFSWTSNNNLFGDTGGVVTTAPAVFNSSNTDDWYGISDFEDANGDGLTGTITLTFSGLDDAFTYDLVIGGAGGAGDATAGRADTLWTVDGQSATTRAFETDGSAYVSFIGLSTDGSGNLVMTGTGTSDFDRPDIAVVSALHLTVTDGTGQTAFQAWATGGESFDGDANGDGVPDGVAFLLGAPTPATDATGLLPTATRTPGGLVLAFNCLPVADRGDAELRVEHSSDLGVLDPWLATVDEVPDADDPAADNGVTFVVDTVSAAPLNKVTATISSAEASDGKLFARLKGVENPSP
jgi:hypothetical protein